jgi:glycerophosphoryl diester phosphodiesterase
VGIVVAASVLAASGGVAYWQVGSGHPSEAASAPSAVPTLTPKAMPVRPAGAPCTLPAGAAHRGASSEEPENTMAAFSRAVAEGAPAIELDVQWTRDGIPVIMHDDTVDRTTRGHGAVASMTAAEVAKLDAGRGQHVPTLESVLVMAAKAKTLVLVELKTVPTSEQVPKLLDVLRRSGAPVIVHSFLRKALQTLHAADASVQAGLTTADDVTPADAAGFGHFLNIRADRITPDKVRAWQAAGMKVYAWTVDERDRWASLAAAGVDGIVTNKVGPYVEWRRGQCAGEKAGAAPTGASAVPR